jgi:hypothetical protein
VATGDGLVDAGELVELVYELALGVLAGGATGGAL